MRSQGFFLKHLIIVILVVFSLGAILVAAFAVRNPTNLQTSALGCAQKPRMVLESTNKYETMVIYHLKLVNNCSSSNEFLIKVASFPTSPAQYDNWKWKFKNGDWNSPFKTEPLAGTSDISLTIQRPLNESGLPQEIQKGIYRNFTVETALANSPGSADSLELIYTID